VNASSADWVYTASIDQNIIDRHPTYRAILVAATAINLEALGPVVDSLVTAANDSVRDWSPEATNEGDAHVTLWQEVYRTFGANPRRTRVSVDALLRRTAQSGLPRIGPLVDTYNALSVIYRVPFGGEDLDRYQGPARLHLSAGDEPFHTTNNGEAVVESPEVGEPVWTDDIGVTCRRWNWRQTNRTAITEVTVNAGFIVDSLDAPDHPGATRAAEHLASILTSISQVTMMARLPRATAG
jgi:DNA/RNA-binding domain of Phe-tRNA-synthetase-like protein